WRAISSKLARNSDAMRRARPTNWPTLRIIKGRSLGPTTIRARSPMIRSSSPPIPGPSIAQGLRERLAVQILTLAVGARQGADPFRGAVVGLGLIAFVLETVAEGADALGGVAHQTGQFA